MKGLATILFLTFTVISYGQDTASNELKPTPTGFVKYSLNKRLSFFPFTSAKQIKLVSFHLQDDAIKGQQRRSYSIPLLNGKVDLSKLTDVVELNSSQIDSLTDILYNDCSKWTLIEQSKVMCYMPRNAIVFYNQKNEPFEYIEICFECLGFKTSSNEIISPDKCDIMFKELQLLFERYGLSTKMSNK
ncbi:hypothetical protein ESA94_20815 [Lacibacter luteus]|uniref:Uncharacterized protein n=2 Tax=Lacibacter luteus TaxID=2508719 RepID=A0A4Q1CD68_9BACT|nr:hypothetical protein ESA94_20815 [Lacibacter luteus]